uniref:Uncharacterized protein n=1 Tax=Triticum urartu TaxID=4572 RepID=A0A8R7QCS1_TRIUA
FPNHHIRSTPSSSLLVTRAATPLLAPHPHPCRGAHPSHHRAQLPSRFSSSQNHIPLFRLHGDGRIEASLAQVGGSSRAPDAGGRVPPLRQSHCTSPSSSPAPLPQCTSLPTSSPTSLRVSPPRRTTS